MTQFIQVPTRHCAALAAPWAAVLAKVNGGYIAFDSQATYRQWRSQR